MSAATQNYVDSLRTDLKRAQETIERLRDTVTALEEENALYALNEAILLGRFNKAKK